MVELSNHDFACKKVRVAESNFLIAIALIHHIIVLFQNFYVDAFRILLVTSCNWKSEADSRLKSLKKTFFSELRRETLHNLIINKTKLFQTSCFGQIHHHDDYNIVHIFERLAFRNGWRTVGQQYFWYHYWLVSDLINSSLKLRFRYDFITEFIARSWSYKTE